jgi:hypothetical protein
MTAKIAKGATVTLYETSVNFFDMKTASDNIWLLRTTEEVDALRAADKAAGRYHDDGGEPILYGKYSSWPDGVDTVTVVVTSRRPTWEGWDRRPKNLRAGYCASLDRQVLFQAE